MRELLFLLLFQGFCVAIGRTKSKYVREGEMVLLQCPPLQVWSAHTPAGKLHLREKQSEVRAEENPVLIDGRNLVLLNASMDQQGNYSCLLGNSSGGARFNLTVYPAWTPLATTIFSETCDQGSSCPELKCPDVIPNITSLSRRATKWHKDNKALAASFKGYFKSVDITDSGQYTCTRLYESQGRFYHMTRTTKLNIDDHSTEDIATIISPQKGEIFQVDIGSSFVIDCKAVVYDFDFDEVYWWDGNSTVDTNKNSSVYSSTLTEEDNTISKSLIFPKVTEKHLTKSFTCRLVSSGPHSNVTVHLARKARPVFPRAALWIIGVVVGVVTISTVIYVKLKIDIKLFLRDTLGCYKNTSDGKSYDAYVMCYRSDAETGLSGEEKRQLEQVLEDDLGYNLCVFDRDVSLGTAVADAVLGCIEQSRRVILIPSSQGPCPDSDLLSAIHAALVERQTRLVLIRTQSAVAVAEQPGQGPGEEDPSFTETLQLVINAAGSCVTWGGSGSSSFWKQLRYHLPAPQRFQKMAAYSAC